MKTVLYMGMSVNGFIAKKDGNSQWTSEEDLKGFFEHSKSAGNIIMGKNTYLEALRYGYFPFPEALNIIVSHEPIKNTWNDRVLTTDKPPQEILRLLEARGFTTAFLAGGGQLNRSFIKEKLIDEIYIDVEPFVFGQGIPIFAEGDFAVDLELLEVKKINIHTIQLHYQVLK
ncbi:dihydrofolate reductase [Candidatus Uhrbacteria bacterium]|nr:dihydrofolate reductase [Candidatus Uhrbacteria bacterium]